MTNFFPRFVEENEDLMREVTKAELELVIQSSQKDKSPRSNGLPTEFYQACFEFIGDNLLGSIKYSRIRGRILAPFNATFLSLIPKSDKPSSFDQFRPISLCNNI